MRIAFAYGPYSLGGKQINVADPENDPQGLTGSEWSCFAFAREMKRRGHEVSLYLPRKRPCDILEALTWEGVRLRELTFLRSEPCDVAIAWNEPDLLSGLHPKTLRIVNQQLNDFWYAKPDYDRYVDIYTSPSESHLIHLRDQTLSPYKWRILPNGCDPTLYRTAQPEVFRVPKTGIREEGSWCPDKPLPPGEPVPEVCSEMASRRPIKKVPGRVIYASSPDRGLHQLLPLWPEIKRQVPNAHLRIFYDLSKWWQLADAPEQSIAPRHRESKRRALAVRELMQAGLEGVEIIGPVSRNRMAKEMSEAVVLAYPCDPYVWTEGFSVTTMEACAAGCVPVITDADALGEIYSDACPMVRRPRAGKMDGHEFRKAVVGVLQNDYGRESVLANTIPLAEQYTWVKCAERLEAIIRRGP